jgi:hypothetical protein
MSQLMSPLVEGVRLQGGERAPLEGACVRGAQADRGCRARLEGFLPAGRAEAPTVTRDEPRKSMCGHGRAEVVAVRPGELEEFVGHDCAHGVDAVVISAGVAAAVTVEARERVEAARFEVPTEDVPGHA